MIAPTTTLASGAQIPVIAFGAFGSDRYTPADVAAAVAGAISIGYRHIDCAAVYGNERAVGLAIRQSGLSRDELWVTGKLWNDRHANPEAACEDSLRDLGLDYFDLYLIHWPYRNAHAPGVGVDCGDPRARPYLHRDYLNTWHGLERLYARGLVRHIGTSNMSKPKLEQLIADALIRPTAN